MVMTKDIFFYSNFCQFSKDVMGIMTKHNIYDQFILVCVDNKKYKIPQFIDRVPSILKQAGEVFTDEELYKYLESKYKSTHSVTEDISPTLSLYGNSLYSSSFSPIDGTEEEDNPNFLNLGRDQRMISVANETNPSSGSKKAENDSTVAYEQLMASRTNDDKFIKQGLGIKQ